MGILERGMQPSAFWHTFRLVDPPEKSAAPFLALALSSFPNEQSPVETKKGADRGARFTPLK